LRREKRRARKAGRRRTAVHRRRVQSPTVRSHLQGEIG
jgi:hypothetical protein